MRNPIQAIAMLIVAGALLSGLFMNCGEVSFDSNEAGTLTGSSTSTGSETMPSETDNELLQNLPPEERDIFRPITDIEKDPSLIEIYKCPGGDGILICHFPANVDNAHTLCVGGNAPNSHKRHEVVVDDQGNVVSLSDYLGPCKH